MAASALSVRRMPGPLSEGLRVRHIANLRAECRLIQDCRLGHPHFLRRHSAQGLDARSISLRIPAPKEATDKGAARSAAYCIPNPTKTASRCRLVQPYPI